MDKPTTMDKLSGLKPITAFLLLAALAGCSGGSGGGLSLSGGSVPTGGGSIKGLVVLPNSQPLTGATISVQALATGQTVSAVPTLSPDGTFGITGLPTGEDLEVLFQQAGGPTLKVVIPQAQLPAPSSQAVDIGTVNALTTVVAQSLAQEVSQDQTQASQIVSEQLGPLTTSLQGEHQNENDQSAEIADNATLTAAAKTLIMNTANAQLQSFAASPTTASATVALHSLLAEIAKTSGTRIHLVDAQQTALINAQLAGTTYSASALATDVTAAGTPATASAVTAADGAQRTQLPAWASLGPGIGPFEALSISASPPQAGGFGLTQAGVTQFVSRLLGG